MKTQQEVQNAKSIKDLQDDCYMGIPIITVYSISNHHWIVFYGGIMADDKKDMEYKMQTYYSPDENTPEAEKRVLTTVKSFIKDGINAGTILNVGDEPDYETLDRFFFDSTKKKYEYILSKNSTLMGVLSLDDPASIHIAIREARKNGGKRKYSIKGKIKEGYLVAIDYDYQRGKLRAYVNDGVNGWGPSRFSSAARQANTVYVVTNLTHNSQYYVIPLNEDLSFTATY